MARGTRILLALIVSVLVIPGGARGGTADRLYLLSSGTGRYVWSTDPADPDLPAATASFRCEVSLQRISTVPCTQIWRGQGVFLIGFGPGALLDAPLAWTAAGGPTFHLGVSVEMTGTVELHACVYKGNQLFESPAASEVSPGVWEGTFSTTASIDPDTRTTLGVCLHMVGNPRSITVATAGASYFAFEQPFAAKSIPELVAESTYAPAPSSFASADHSFTFNDGDWALQPFAGDTTAEVDVPISLPSGAAAVYAYIDGLAEPPAYRAAHGQAPHTGTFSDRPVLSIVRAGTEVSRGPIAVGAVSLAPGDYVLEINPADYLPAPQLHQDFAYAGYVLIVFGERTLASLTWRFPPSAAATFRTPVASNFPPETESVPVPPSATTMRADLSVDKVNPLPQRWLFSFGIPGHGGDGGPSGSRYVLQGGGVMRATTVPASDQVMVTTQEEVFTVALSFTYAPA